MLSSDRAPLYYLSLRTRDGVVEVAVVVVVVVAVAVGDAVQRCRDADHQCWEVVEGSLLGIRSGVIGD
jgi:hypothetical protein